MTTIYITPFELLIYIYTHKRRLLLAFFSFSVKVRVNETPIKDGEGAGV